MIMDIDYFKNINDTYGHTAGDLVLNDISKAIKSNVRDYDIVGRYGGEEFIVILPHTSVGMAKRMAERLRKTIKLLQVNNISVTVSIGVTRNMPEDTSIDDLVKRADMHLYEAKQSGRDCVITSDSEQ
jgi:diguanylate cyclase (GGDEF)-like protein